VCILAGSVFVFELALNYKTRKRLEVWSNISLLVKDYKINREKALNLENIESRPALRKSNKQVLIPESPKPSEAHIRRGAVVKPIEISKEKNLIDKPTPHEVKLYTLPKVSKEIFGARAVSEDVNNILWRVFVWEDMLNDFIRTKNVFGVNFGKPFQSYIAGKLGWQNGEDVGWIEPHNSYLHILYRSGLIGLVIIFFILCIFSRMAFYFASVSDFTGIILSANLLYWLALANFIVLFELPYFAIPLWISFGFTYAYYRNKKKLVIKD